MTPPSSELWEKIRQQFDTAPYPNVPLERSPHDSIEPLFLHDIRTAYYKRHQQVIDPAGTVILDAGCGSGYKSLVLATANPGATIIGVDLSEASVNLARDRLTYHGIQHASFHALNLDDLPSLGLQFDYINCDEVLYLCPDIAQTLRTFKTVLKPTGIIRANLHSALHRFLAFRAQKLFTLMGLMDTNPEALEIEIVKDTFEALEDWVDIKQKAWKNRAALQKFQLNEADEAEYILMNFLFQGDKGYTIADLFTALEAADLDFVTMVNWRQWELTDLFQEPDNLPAFWAMSLPDVPLAQQLYLKELLHPQHRLLDFWCGHPGHTPPTPPSDWSEAEWRTVQVQLHPQLKTSRVYQDLLQAIAACEAFTISQYIPATQAKQSIFLKHPMAACLLPLWDGPQPVQALIDRWLHLLPYDLITLAPIQPTQAFVEVTAMIASLEACCYLLLEKPI